MSRQVHDTSPAAGTGRVGLCRRWSIRRHVLDKRGRVAAYDQVTDRSDEFQAAEIVREKLTLRLRQELPYGLTVVLEQFKEEDGSLLINAVIWVERSGQKAIVIGNGGEQLKEVGRAARLEMVELFKRPVHLELWVKVKENWSDNEIALRQLGYE